MNFTAVEPFSASRLEQELRQRLGIPQEAQQVLLLAESSHWDPNWLWTSEEYYRRFVRRNLELALAELQREPRRVYSIECVFFLRRYWEDHPQQRDLIRELINSRRLRMTSSGVTTADTLLPQPEAILRDLLLGQEWLRANGMTQEPRLAYFPDSFGYSPVLPSLLNAAGFDRAAITRVDGMFFPGCDYESRGRFQWAGSTAATLMKQERTLDFIWRDSGGGEVLCHWNAFTYGQGDMLAYRGASRVYLVPFYREDRSEKNVARRIQQFAAQLVPVSRTPYLFCPIGFDFIAPIPGLLALLERYNQRSYPQTGIWVVNAGLDDYLELVNCYRPQLPVLALDPNPYWTGFYSARPSLKAKAHQLVDALVLAEGLALKPENASQTHQVVRQLENAWWNAAVSNHHDFITGTGADRVVDTEQVPWLEEGIATARAVIERLRKPVLSIRQSTSGSRVLPEAKVEWRKKNGRLEIRAPRCALELSEEAGGCITRAWDPESGFSLLEGLSNDLISYRDAGGLWRMGHEFKGGAFREVARSSLKPARLEVVPLEQGVMVSCMSELDGMMLTRWLWLPGSPTGMILGRVQGRARDGRTVTVRFETGIQTDQVVMDQPGGVLSRPVEKRYKPTFWPVYSFFHVRSSTSGDGSGVAFLRGIPGAVAYRPGGAVELVAQRNANQERAYGLIKFLGMPVNGHERQVSTIDYGLLFTPAGDWQTNRLPVEARRVMAAWPGSVSWRAELDALVREFIAIDPPEVQVLAIKPAWRGEGLIVRLYAPGQQDAGSQGRRPVSLRMLRDSVKSAFLCDARERDLQPLDVEGNTIRLVMPGSLASVRIVG